MLGAIAGDIVGSPYEFHNIKTVDFPLFISCSKFTDDSVMTLAVAKWLTDDAEHTPQYLVRCMQELGRRYPRAGYGGSFARWLCGSDPQPYHSWGNGAGMRVSPVGMYAKTLEEALSLAEISAAVSHDHPEGIKGAQAVASAVFLARTSDDLWSESTKKTIKDFISERFGYDLDRTTDGIRPGYSFDVSCQGSVPEAIRAYLDSGSFEETLRKAVSIGGDSDTIACMAGAVAGAHGGIPEDIDAECRRRLTPDLLDILDKFENMLKDR